MAKYLTALVLVVALDQLSKLIAAAYLIRGTIELTPFLNLTLVYNTGAAFGFLNDAAGWQNLFFVGVAALASVVILVMLWRLPPGANLLGSGLALIGGGALGNLIDRLFHGHVIDFIDFYYRSWHWPAFNVADSAITVGAALLVADALGLGARKPHA